MHEFWGQWPSVVHSNTRGKGITKHKKDHPLVRPAYFKSPLLLLLFNNSTAFAESDWKKIFIEILFF